MYQSRGREEVGGWANGVRHPVNSSAALSKQPRGVVMASVVSVKHPIKANKFVKALVKISASLRADGYSIKYASHASPICACETRTNYTLYAIDKREERCDVSLRCIFSRIATTYDVQSFAEQLSQMDEAYDNGVKAFIVCSRSEKDARRAAKKMKTLEDISMKMQLKSIEEVVTKFTLKRR